MGCPPRRRSSGGWTSPRIPRVPASWDRPPSWRLPASHPTPLLLSAANSSAKTFSVSSSPAPPPPPGGNPNLPPETDEKPQTNRERLQFHLSSKTCAGCHVLVDTIGFGL